MKKKQDIIRAQCNKCGLIADRIKYTDGTYSTKCRACGVIGVGFKVIK